MSIDSTHYSAPAGCATFSLRSLLAAVAVLAITSWMLSDELFEKRKLWMSRGQYRMRADVENVEPKLTDWLNDRGFEKVSQSDILVESSAVPEKHVLSGDG